MDPSKRSAESIMERIKNEKQNLNFLKDDVEHFLQNVDDCRSRSEFACKFLTKLTQSITNRIKTGTMMNGNDLDDLVDTVVVCHDQIFNRGYDCSEEENSLIGRCLYAGLYSIAGKYLQQAIVLSDLILKSISRNHQIPCSAQIGSIVRNSFLLLWNAGGKMDHLPAQALGLRQMALTHLSLSDDPNSATKFCDRAACAALVYNAASQKRTERDTNVLGNFTSFILDLFRNRLLGLLSCGKDEETQSAVQNLVKLIHVNVNHQQKSGRLEDNDEFLSKVKLLLDATNNFQKYLTNNGSLKFSFHILDFALCLMKTASNNSTAQLTHKMFDRLIARLTGFRNAEFTQFDENCFGTAVTTLRFSFFSILEKASSCSEVIQRLVPFFDRIASLLTLAAQCSASISTTSADSVTLLEDLIIYECHHSNCILDANEFVFKKDLRIMTSTLEAFHRVLFRTAKDRGELIAKFVDRVLNIAAIPQKKTMYAEVVDVVYRYAEEFIESFGGDETSLQNQTFWKRMGFLVRCLIKSRRFHDALQLLAKFLCKGHVESDGKTVALWASVLKEARFQQEDTVKDITIPKLVTKFCAAETTFSRSRMSLILAEEIEILKTQQCPVEELYPLLCDLLKFAEEPFHKYSALIDLARILLSKAPQYDSEGRTASDCCKRALDLLNYPVTQKERWFAAQAKFIGYLVRLRQIYDGLDHKVTRQRERMNQLLKIQKKEMEKLSAAVVAAAADESDQPDNLAQDASDFASYQPSNLSEELKCMSELDECVDAWMVVLADDADDDHTEVVQCVRAVLNDLELAAEIYSNSRIFRREIGVRQLYVKLAKRHGKWMTFIKGSCQLVCTLARIGLNDVAEEVLREAASNADRVNCESNSAEAIAQTSIDLQLAHSELRLMQGRVMDGFQHLCTAMDLIRAGKKYKTMFLLEGRSLLLCSKYREFVSSGNLLLSPLEYASNALRMFLSLLNVCAANNYAETFNAELIGCLLDSSLQLSRLFYDVGLLRNARFFLREQMSWSQRFLCVTRTAENLLLSARIALDIGEICDCQTKLNAVRHVVDAKDESGPSRNKLCPLPGVLDLSESFDTDNFLSSPIRAERVLAKLEPASNLKTSPCLWPSSSSEANTQFDFVSFDGHPIKCPCSWCCNVALIRIRADFIVINYELAESPRVDAILKRIKLLAHSEKRLMKKMSASNAVSSSSLPPSQIDIATCWMLSRRVDSLLEAKSGVRAFKLLMTAFKLLSKVQVGLSLLNFLRATLAYQECVCMLIVKASKDRKRSVSEFCGPAWSHNRIVDSSDVQRLTVDFGRFVFGENAKTPAREFKTPRRPAIKLEERKRGKSKVDLNEAFSENSSSSSSTTKSIGCRAPSRTTTKSFFQHNFEEDDDDDDSDVIEIIHDSNVEKKASNDDIAVQSAKKKQPEKLKRHAVPTIEMTEKENSDIDDLMMSPPVAQKKIRKVAAGRVLRSKTKITDLELGDVADSEASDNSSVKAKKARKSPAVKHLHGSPLEASSRMNVECPRGIEKRNVTGRITRSKALMTDEQEVERFRAKSPMVVYRWRATDRRPIIESPNHADEVQDDFEIERPFDMHVVVQKLDEALQSIVRFPRPPLYSDLNILLALCKGDKTRDDSRNGVEHILESVSVSFRHLAELRIKPGVDDASAVPPKKDLERRQILSHTGGSMLSKDNGDEGIQRVTNRLPKDWVVCQINALPNAFSGDSSNPELILTRLENGKRPIMVKIANSCKNEVVRDIFTEFEAIMTENKQVMKVTTSATWWDVRKALDARLKNFLSSLENTILGAWKCLLLGGRATEEHRSQLKEVIREVTKQLNDTLHICSVDEHLLELVLDCWPSLKDRSDCWRPAVAHVCRLTDIADSKIEAVHSVFNVLTTKLSYDVNRHALVLVLDQYLHGLPWENIPVLRDHAVTRMPSIHALLGHLFLHANIQSVPEHPKVDTSNSFYVLNPSKDLVKTQTVFTPIFEKLKWSGVTSQAPTTTEWLNALSEKDLFVYCGHGSGTVFACSDKIIRITCRAVSLLMGCSSATLKSQGTRFEPLGTIHSYILAGCPYVMGNLWDVTDKDIDRLLVALLGLWIPGSEQKCNSLAHNLPSARLKAILNYLIGAAPVAYGIPVYS